MLRKKQEKKDIEDTSIVIPQNEKTTIIGQGAKFTGTLESDNLIRIAGKVEGNITGNASVIVDETAFVRAGISVRELIIHGKVEGNVQASEKIELSNSARLYGNIKSPRMIMATGAIFQGKVSMD